MRFLGFSDDVHIAEHLLIMGKKAAKSTLSLKMDEHFCNSSAFSNFNRRVEKKGCDVSIFRDFSRIISHTIPTKKKDWSSTIKLIDLVNRGNCAHLEHLLCTIARLPI